MQADDNLLTSLHGCYPAHKDNNLNNLNKLNPTPEP